jgi:GntR family transcriptional repressor for pyruvate dehydrogenase complex
MEGSMKEQQKDTWLTPVSKQSRSKLVLEKIKEAIINKELKPGDFLPSENEFVARLGVGKSSVREAIKMLEAIGVVEICRGQGSIIKNNVDNSIMNPLIFQLILQNNPNEYLLELRMMFETSATILASHNANEADFELLKSSVKKLEEDLNQGIKSVDNDVEFHKLIWQATHNPFIILIGETIIELFRPSLEISNQKFVDQVLKDHKAILTAFLEKDEEKIRRTITESLTRWNDKILHDCVN